MAFAAEDQMAMKGPDTSQALFNELEAMLRQTSPRLSSEQLLTLADELHDVIRSRRGGGLGPEPRSFIQMAAQRS